MNFPHDIDSTTGNIDSGEDVFIAGAIKDGMAVRARGSVCVEGLIEAADVGSERDLQAKAGVVARERGTLSAGRDLFAKYLDNVRAEVGRDLIIDREMINCHANVSRHVACEDGAISGGAVIAGGACVVGQLGAPSGTPTKLALGRIHEIEYLAEKAVGLLKIVSGRRERLLDRLQRVGESETSADKARLQAQIDRLGRHATNLSQRLAAIRITVAQYTLVDLTVHRRICVGVTLYIGSMSFDFEREVAGPLRIFLPAGELGASDTDEIMPICNDLTTGRVCELDKLTNVRRWPRYQGPVPEGEGVELGRRSGTRAA